MDNRAFDLSVALQSIPALLSYLDVTLIVGISSIVLGSLLGFVLASFKLSHHKSLKYLAVAYTYIMRCTPSIVLLFIVFYGLPQVADALFGLDLNQLHRGVFAVITFTLLFGAYISEVFRAAYLAVPKGQYEAAVSLGLSSWKAFYHVIFPQATLVALPNFGNSVINLLKEGALAYTIGLIDLIGKGNLIIAQNYGAYGIEIYFACMLLYWAMTIAIEKGVARLEKHLNHGQGFVKVRSDYKVEKRNWLPVKFKLKRREVVHGA